MITAYRCHGWAFTRGIPIKEIMAEMMGTIHCVSSFLQWLKKYTAHNAHRQAGKLVVPRVKVVLLTCTAAGDSSLVVTGLLEHRYLLIQSVTTVTK